MTHDYEDEDIALTPEQRKRAEALSEMAHAAYSTPRINDALPLGHLSHTQVDMYLRCARQYEFRYVKGEMQPPGVALTCWTRVEPPWTLLSGNVNRQEKCL